MVTSIDRRTFVKAVAFTAIGLSFTPKFSLATDCGVEHPFMPPREQYGGQCPVCGMVRAMWARTWITFDPVDSVSQVCSFHCLADWIIKSGKTPSNILLAVYHQPEKTVPALAAFIVMGSSAPGTMSPVSKIVFADNPSARRFAGSCGGKIVDFSKALVTAETNVINENKAINTRRLKKGKIVEPHGNTSCPVCGMFPIRYPHARCQIQTKNGKTLHFCSSQCMFAFLGNQRFYIKQPVEPVLIWVIDRESGAWISGRAAFYVIGSTKVFGPMGYEALPFDALKTARTFAARNGGAVEMFSSVTIYKIVPNWKYCGKRAHF